MLVLGLLLVKGSNVHVPLGRYPVHYFPAGRPSLNRTSKQTTFGLSDMMMKLWWPATGWHMLSKSDRNRVLREIAAYTDEISSTKCWSGADENYFWRYIATTNKAVLGVMLQARALGGAYWVGLSAPRFSKPDSNTRP
jgi:hypothetical protein